MRMRTIKSGGKGLRLPKKEAAVKPPKRGRLQIGTAIGAVGLAFGADLRSEREKAVDALLAEIAILNQAGEGWMRVRRIEQCFGRCQPMDGGTPLATSVVSPDELKATLVDAIAKLRNPRPGAGARRGTVKAIRRET